MPQRSDYVQSERVVRVFVASPFGDIHAERDHLVPVALPVLRERS